MSNFYRAEDGERGDGHEPPEARDNGRGMRSRAEFLKPRPPDGAKRRRGALAEFRRRRKGCECDGVGSRREETPRGQGAKRPVVIQKLHIDDGCMGGGGSISASSESEAYSSDFTSERKEIFKYCLLTNDNSNPYLADDAFSIRGNAPTQSIQRVFTQALLHYCTWMDSDNDGILDYFDMDDDDDGDGLPDSWEDFMGLKQNSDEIEGIGFRVIKIYDNRIVTKMYHLYEDELNLYSNDENAIEDISGDYADSPYYESSYILYPSLGCPAILQNGGTLDVFVKNADENDIFSAKIINSFNKNIVFDLALAGTSDDSLDKGGNNDGAAHVVFVLQTRYYFEEIPSGFYDLVISHDYVEYFSYHSVQIIDNFNDCDYIDGKTDTPLTIVQVTDMHIGEGEGDNTNVDRFKAVINRVNEFIKPDFVFVTGDMTESGKEDEMKYFKASLLDSTVPIFCTPGNHDHRDNGHTKSMTHDKYEAVGCLNYQKYISPVFFDDEKEDRTSEIKTDNGGWQMHCAGLDYAFDYGDFHFITFDSGPGGIDDVETNGLSDVQLDWIKWSQEQAVLDGKEHSFIFTHGPFSGHDTDGFNSHDQNDGVFIEWAEGLYNSKVDEKIDAVFCGHTHDPWIFYDVYPTEYPYNGKGYDGKDLRKHWGDGPTVKNTVWNEFIIEYSFQPVWYIETAALN